jgi:predicted signal transduction protein with EAL and GGDEF domain
VGDQVLQKISERLKREVRGQDHVARLGGDELAAVMEGFRNDQDVTLIAHHISKVLSEPIIFDSFIVEVSCSIGGASYPTNGDTVEMLLERADKAMYESKQKHKGSFHFYSQAMNEAARHFLELEKDLHFALKRNEFQLFYQPLVASENEAVMAVECFLRWHHPERGMVLPSEFLPSAERSNVIELIGKWVIEQALKEYKAWQNLGIAPQTLAINLSARQLNNDYFVDMVNALLKTHNVPPHVLSFEVQEAHIIERKGKIGSTIQGLQWLGVGIHVDHFSGEHISCVQMITLSVDRLKLGHRITSNVGANKRYQSAMSGLIDFAKQLKLALVAEGVESQEQYDFLKGKGCELLQGYFIKRPTEAKKFRAWLVQSQQARIAKENSLPVS